MQYNNRSTKLTKKKIYYM